MFLSECVMNMYGPLGNVERDLEWGDEEQRDGAVQLLAAQLGARHVIPATARHLCVREHRKTQSHGEDAVAPADQHPMREEQDEAAGPALHIVQWVARRYSNYQWSDDLESNPNKFRECAYAVLYLACSRSQKVRERKESGCSRKRPARTGGSSMELTWLTTGAVCSIWHK